MDLVGGSELDPLQRKGKKERKLRTEAVASDHHAVIAEFVRLFTEKSGSRPDIAGGRDGKIVSDLLKAHPLDQVLELLRGFFRVGTRYVRENGSYTLPMFKTSFNELLVMQQRGDL